MVFRRSEYGGEFMSKENTGITRVSEDVVVSIATAAINDVKGVEKICTGAGIVKKIFTKDEPVSVKIRPKQSRSYCD